MSTFSYLEIWETGGAQKYYQEVMSSLNNDVIIVCNKEALKRTYTKKKFSKNKLIYFNPINLSKQLNFKNNYITYIINKTYILLVPLIFILNIIRFLYLLRSNKAKLVLSFNGGYPGSYSSLSLNVASYLLNIKNILFVLNSPQKRNTYYFFIQFIIDKILNKSVNKIIVNSKFQKKKLITKRNFDKKKIKVIYNGIKIVKKKFLNLKKKNYSIGVVSRLEKNKNIDKLIYSIKILNNKISNNFYLHIAGGGSEINKLKTIVKKNKLKKNVKFYNFIQEDKLHLFYKKIQFFIFTSACEGLPYSILEAMNYKKIIITSNVGGISEAIRNNREGILIKNINEEKIFYTVKKIYNNKKFLKKLTRNAKIRCKNLFDCKKSKLNFKKLFYNYL